MYKGLRSLGLQRPPLLGLLCMGWRSDLREVMTGAEDWNHVLKAELKTCFSWSNLINILILSEKENQCTSFCVVVGCFVWAYISLFPALCNFLSGVPATSSQFTIKQDSFCQRIHSLLCQIIMVDTGWKFHGFASWFISNSCSFSSIYLSTPLGNCFALQMLFFWCCTCEYIYSAI